MCNKSDGSAHHMDVRSGVPRWWAYIVAVGLLNLAACSGQSTDVSTPSPTRAQAETLMVDGQQPAYPSRGA
jgi:hypothetical protein